MERKKIKKNYRRRINQLTLMAMLGWTGIFAVSAAWNVGREHDKVLSLARAEAIANLNKDRAFRLWAASKGGIYLPVDEKTQPNPHLSHLRDRDLTVPGGTHLTLINPATMLREIGEQQSQLFGVRAKITGRKFLNPANRPDSWELKALDTFDRTRQPEVAEPTEIDGQPFLRVMQPMFMEPDCLKCHAVTGIKVGELRGATGVAIPLEPYYRIERDSMVGMLGTHGVIWLTGLGLIGFVSMRSKRHELERIAAEKELRKLSRAVEQSASSVMITDTRGVIQYVNPKFCEMTGYAEAELLGNKPGILKSDETDPELYRDMWTALRAGQEWHGEFKNRKKDGELFWCMETISAIKDDAGTATHFVAVLEDISERKFNEETIRRLAYYDSLTDLPNRRYFRERLEQIAAWSHRAGCQLALLYIDLDRFKEANDSLGHSAGDQLLRTMGVRLGQCLREGDMLARLGGDEFALIVSNINRHEDAAIVAEKVIHTIGETVLIEGNELYVTASVGISLFPTDSTDLGELVKNADIALYHAKEQGKNTYRFYSRDINARTIDHLKLESDLRKAVERGELYLDYQPQIDLRSQKVHGVEALARWRHPERGLISPGVFIPLAEESGLIVAIGEWVFRTACRQLRAWDDSGLPRLAMSINLSALQFCRKGLLEFIQATLEETGVAAGRIELEITESVLMKKPEESGETLRALENLGVRVAIDDFGTGYSSLNYLKRFPVSVLKIDQSFVRDISSSSDDRAIAQAVISLARGMGLSVVAEGVETADQLGVLRDLQCDIVQGYFYSKPVSEESIRSFLLDRQAI